MHINASLVKELRNKTGLAMMLCKKALTECKGDMNKALEFLKKHSKVEKITNSAAKEGVVSVLVKDHNAVIVEVNSNTDFVARNDNFQKLVEQLTQKAILLENLDELLNSYISKTNSVKDLIIEVSNLIGEKIDIKRFTKLNSKNAIIGSYIHNKIGNNMGKMAALVTLELAEKTQTQRKNIEKILQETADQIAMHIAASNPIAIDLENLDQDFLENERKIFEKQAREKTDKDIIINNIVQGKIQKFLEEILLVKQNFVLNDKIKVQNLLDSVSKTIGNKIYISNFCKMEVGQ